MQQDKTLRIVFLGYIFAAGMGSVIGGLLVTAILGVSPAQVAAQAPQRLFGTHPTNGRAIPISTTSEGYINVRVIP